MAAVRRTVIRWRAAGRARRSAPGRRRPRCRSAGPARHRRRPGAGSGRCRPPVPGWRAGKTRVSIHETVVSFAMRWLATGPGRGPGSERSVVGGWDARPAARRVLTEPALGPFPLVQGRVSGLAELGGDDSPRYLGDRVRIGQGEQPGRHEVVDGSGQVPGQRAAVIEVVPAGPHHPAALRSAQHEPCQQLGVQVRAGLAHRPAPHPPDRAPVSATRT
jgi:hypothetical protein